MIDSDPGEYFFNPEIHALLKKVTGFDEQKIFARQPRRANLKAPKYEFMLKADYDKVCYRSTAFSNQKCQLGK